MTDLQVDPQTEIAALAAAEESARIDEELQGALNTINANLELIHATSDPDQRLAIAENTAEWCGYLGKLVESSTALIGAAVDVGREALKQRDAAMDELSKLVNAVENIDRNNPLVETLVEGVEEAIGEFAYDDAMEYAYENLSEELVFEVSEAMEVTSTLADSFLDVLRGNYNPHIYVPARAPEIEVIDLLIARLEARRARVALNPAVEEEDESDDDDYDDEDGDDA